MIFMRTKLVMVMRVIQEESSAMEPINVAVGSDDDVDIYRTI